MSKVVASPSRNQEEWRTPIRRSPAKGTLLLADSPHTGLLWALETLAWDPEYLPRVAVILARLARFDPGGKLHNRPINSVREIFLPWHPGTNAGRTQRLAALDYVISAEPSIAWDLLVGLFPEHHDVAHPTARPRYREAGGSEREQLTWARVFEGYRSIVERALGLVADDPSRWQVLIRKVAQFEEPLRQRTYDLLESFVERGAGGERRLLWEALQKEIYRHRAFQTAAWSLKEPELTRLESIWRRLAPDDLVERVAWLYSEHFPTVPVREGNKRQGAVEERRKEAVREIYADGNEAGLLTLAERVKLPQFVAVGAADVLEHLANYREALSRSV